MAQYNIEMNSYNGSQYNKLYPRTLLNNVTDWNGSIYSKSEVDGFVKLKMGQFQLVNQIDCTNKKTWIDINFNGKIADYSALFIYIENLKGKNFDRNYLQTSNGIRLGDIKLYEESSYYEDSLVLFLICKNYGYCSIVDTGELATIRFITSFERTQDEDISLRLSNGDSGVANEGTIYVYGILNT